MCHTSKHRIWSPKHRLVRNISETYHNQAHYTSAIINTVTYRGYHYDRDLGLYYLGSRYYDSEVGRFISPDSVEYLGAGGDFIAYNLYAYCSNNPVNRVDHTGRFWSEIWEFAKTAVAEIGKAMGVMSPAYAGLGGATALDGPLPFADAIALAAAVLLTAGVVGYGVGQATKALAKFTSKAEEKSATIAIPSEPESPVIFPDDPNSFAPIGLVKVPRTGTKNGAFISWMDPHTNTEVFRWDENINYSNGPHYHVYGMGHYYPGNAVPEPYAKAYFPFK